MVPGTSRMDRGGAFCHHGAMARIPTHPSADRAGRRARSGSVTRSLLPLALALVLLGGAAFSIDMPVADWFKGGEWPSGMPKLLIEVADEIARLVTMSEVAAHTVSVAVILALVLALDDGLAWPSGLRGRGRGSARAPLPAAQAAFGRMLGATVTGGILADLLKLCVERIRPRVTDFAAHASVWDTFRESIVETVTGSRSNIQSFPSGHSALAAGLAAALAWRYPRAWRFFALFAAMAAGQRVMSSAHFPSDICFGAALGLAGAAWWLRGAAADGGEEADSV